MQLEHRYVVLKVADCDRYLTKEEQGQLHAICQVIELERARDKRPTLSGIFIESHWPEYEQVVQLLAKRVDARLKPDGGN